MDYQTVHRMRVKHAGRYHTAPITVDGDERKRVDLRRQDCRSSIEVYGDYKEPHIQEHAQRIAARPQ